MKNKNVLFLSQAAMIAAFYVILTFLASSLGLASGSIQIRFSEALTILPYFTQAAVPGLTIGCLLANILTGCALPDMIFGTLATFLGAIGTRMIRKHKWLTPLPPIVANTAIVPFVLYYAYGIRPLWLSFITVGIGEIISCDVLGLILQKSLSRYASRLFTHQY